MMKGRCLSGLLQPRWRQKAALRADTHHNQGKEAAIWISQPPLQERQPHPALWSLKNYYASIAIPLGENPSFPILYFYAGKTIWKCRNLHHFVYGRTEKPPSCVMDSLFQLWMENSFPSLHNNDLCSVPEQQKCLHRCVVVGGHWWYTTRLPLKVWSQTCHGAVVLPEIVWVIHCTCSSRLWWYNNDMMIMMIKHWK